MLTDLEQRLLSDKDGTQVELLRQLLWQLQQRFAAQLLLPQCPSEYTALLCQQQAAQAAEQVVTILAQRYHNRIVI